MTTTNSKSGWRETEDNIEEAKPLVVPGEIVDSRITNAEDPRFAPTPSSADSRAVKSGVPEALSGVGTQIQTTSAVETDAKE